MCVLNSNLLFKLCVEWYQQYWRDSLKYHTLVSHTTIVHGITGQTTSTLVLFVISFSPESHNFLIGFYDRGTNILFFEKYFLVSTPRFKSNCRINKLYPLLEPFTKIKTTKGIC